MFVSFAKSLRTKILYSYKTPSLASRQICHRASVSHLVGLPQHTLNFHHMLVHPFHRLPHLTPPSLLTCPVAPFLPLFWEGFPFKLHQPKKDARFFPWKCTGHLSQKPFCGSGAAGRKCQVVPTWIEEARHLLGRQEWEASDE